MEKKSLYIITNCFPYGTGEKTFILPELSFLLREYSVTIITTASINELKDEKNKTKLDEEIKVIPINYLNSKTYEKIVKSVQAIFSPNMWKEISLICREKDNIIRKLYNAFGYYVYSSIFMQKLKKKINLNKEILFYTYWYNIPTLALTRMKKSDNKIKVITRAHGYDLYNERVACGRQPFRYYMNNKLDGIFFVSNIGLEYYEKNFSYNQKLTNLHLCELGVAEAKNKEKTKHSENYFELVSCSNVIPLKRVDLIVKALSVLKDDVKISWIHFGDGDKLDEIKDLAKKHLSGMKNIKYHFAGYCVNTEILKYYQEHAVECFITSSESEGVPVSIQEALAHGIPIIGTNVGGIPETICDNGILISDNPTPNEIANAIMQIYNADETEKKKLHENSYKIWKEKFDVEVKTKEFIEIIKKIY